MSDARLIEILNEARDWGFLGPGPVAEHARLAEAMARALTGEPDCVLDLGAGGGTPGLVLAGYWPSSRWVLLDSNQRRTLFLADAVHRLGWSERVRVVRARAEEAGRDLVLRRAHDLVVARGFGPPPVTAECAAPFLRVGGLLVVAEPPIVVADRWPADGLALLGLRPTGRHAGHGDGSWVAMVQDRPCPDRYPRRVGVPAKRPLFPVGSPG